MAKKTSAAAEARIKAQKAAETAKTTAKAAPAPAPEPVAKAVSPFKAIKETYTKTGLIARLATLLQEDNALVMNRQQLAEIEGGGAVTLTDAQAKNMVKTLLAEMENIMGGSVTKRGVGEFTWPGFFKISTVAVPARKAGTLVRSPATGEMVEAAARPASTRVKVRALSKLRNAAAPK